MTDLRSSDLRASCMASGCRWSRRFATANSTRRRCGGWCGITSRCPSTDWCSPPRPAKASRCASDETERLVLAVRDEAARARRSSDLPRPVRQQHERTARTTLARTAAWPIDGYLISCPYYSRPSQRGPRTSLQRARRSRRPSGHALQHSLPDRRQSRQRGDAAPGRSSQHRRPQGLLRGPQPVARSACAGVRKTSPF